MTAHARRIVRQKLSDEPNAGLAADVIAGLSAHPKQLPPKYFYDAAGSELFEQITQQPEYYPTRSELEILDAHAGDIAKLIPEGAALIEFGSGSTRKARLLLRELRTLGAYVPVDISGEYLHQETAALRQDFPQLNVVPVEADFTKPFSLPESIAALPRAGFFPGSTLGNFEPHEASAFLRHAGEMVGANGVLILGVDLVKAPELLHAAYNDAAGVTAQFNRNLLVRLNRELGADFDLSAFAHHAFYNAHKSRIEMHLVSARRQRVRIDGASFQFRAGETIHTECSYKYSVDSLRCLARGTGWDPLDVWTDAAGYFSVHALRRSDEV
ncbi:MAG: methyltransferase [Xanthobacteraceae bacterium]|jgi:dimethylhistidine N-methyltransferase|nr:methyltransferase [Xanthobacteraceae bacterium]